MATDFEAWWEEFRKNHKRAKTSSRRIEIDGKFYRKRRGVLVEIPPEWVGVVTHPQTIRKRPSKKGQGPSFKSKAQR